MWRGRRGAGYLRLAEDLAARGFTEGFDPDEGGVANAFLEAVTDVFGWAVRCGREGYRLEDGAAAVTRCGGEESLCG
jgi:hypothetical protein